MGCTLQLPIFFIILGLVLIQSGDGGRPKIQKLNCPSFEIKANTHNKDVRRQYQRKLTRVVYQTPAMPPLSPMAQELAKILIEMVDSNYRVFIDFAFRQAAWVALYVYNIEESDCSSMCSMTSLVNASLDWYENKNGNSSSDALFGIAERHHHTCRDLAAATLRLSRCPPMEYDLPPVYPEKCYKKGFVYDIKKVIKYFGRLYPYALIKTMYALYKSPNYLDRVFAVVTAASISPTQVDIFQNHTIDRIFETFLYVMYPDIPKCCCADRKKRLLDLCDFHYTKLVSTSKKLVKEKYLFDDCLAYTIKQ